MFIRQRPVRIQDLPRLITTARDSQYYSNRDKRDLINMWSEWIHERRVISLLLEDVDVAPDSEIRYASFHLSVFLDDDFAEDAATKLPPPLGSNVLERWRKKWPVSLTERQIIVRNHRAGQPMTLATIHSGFAPPYADTPLGQQVRESIIRLAPGTGEGFHLRQWWLESYTSHQRGWAEAAGLSTLNDYSYHYASLPNPPSVEARASLGAIAASRIRFGDREGCSYAGMLTYRPPLLGLSPAEKDLLTCALFDMDDYEIADHLCISMHTVKKRWSSVFDRVSCALPTLLPGPEKISDSHRGPEKRRLLMLYLRHHREEVRPHAVPGRAGNLSIGPGPISPVTLAKWAG